MEFYTLANGLKLPKVGFGTYRVEGQDGADVVAQAIQAGYRLLDTASFYENEKEVGEGIRRSGVRREDIFVTSKAWRDEMGYENILAAFERSCRRLDMEYLDLFLLHWPRNPSTDPDWKANNAGSWHALEELYHAGRIRAIGVSNFLPEHLAALMETAEVVPMVDQLEYHPGWLQSDAVTYCQSHGIQVEAWSPMGRGRVLEHPLLSMIAEKYAVSPAKLCILFALETNVLPLPKSGNPERMRDNLDAFNIKLDRADVSRIRQMGTVGWSGEDPRRTETF